MVNSARRQLIARPAAAAGQTRGAGLPSECVVASPENVPPPRRGGVRRIAEDRRALAGLLLLAALVAAALVGPFCVGAPLDFVGSPHAAPCWAHPFGTTGQGQDVLSQTVHGARSSLAVGFTVGLLTVGAGAMVGLLAGYLGGWLDAALSLVTNIFLVIPGLPLTIVMAAYLPAGPATMALVLTATGWAWHARVLRAQTLALRGRDFVTSARVAGEGPLRIVVMEILPNMASLLLSSFIGATTYAIGAQVGLEFLGLGDVGAVTWGTNLYWASNDAALLTGSWWTFVPTGLCIAVTGLALTLITTAIDELSNPRLRQERAWRGYLKRHGQRLASATPVVTAS